VTKSKKDIKQQRAALLGMPYGTAEKHLRKSMLHALAQQCGKDICRWCQTKIESHSDLAVVHLHDWADDAALYWDLNNVAFSHVSCAAERGGIQQEDQMERLKVIIEDEQGNQLPGVSHDGQIYVAGKKDQRYNVRVVNTTGKRVLTVITVDGRNVLTGKKGTFRDNGYILAPYESAAIDGWRQTDNTAAAFVFGKKEGAYSSEMGSAENVGVIGVAVFEEKEPDPVTVGNPFVIHTHTTHHHHHQPATWTTSPAIYTGGVAPMSFTSTSVNLNENVGATMDSATIVNTSNSAGPAAAGGDSWSSSSRGVEQERGRPKASREKKIREMTGMRRDRTRRRSRGAAKEHKQEIGTEYGETIQSAVTTAPFKRNTDTPCEVHVVRYDSMKALKEAGIMGRRPKKQKASTPEAFPQEPHVSPGYCQPPPRKRR
jgi:hypothetical protein